MNDGARLVNDNYGLNSIESMYPWAPAAAALASDMFPSLSMNWT